MFEINEGLPTVNTLGIKRNAEKDILISNPGNSKIAKLTKQRFLNKLASIFDPLGLVAPFVIKGKILVQEMWLAGIEWDEDLESSLVEKVQKWTAELKNFDEIRVPKTLQPENAVCVSVHTFVDASEKVYGTTSYLRCVWK